MIREATRLWRRWAAHHRVHVTMLFAIAYIAFSRPEAARLLIGGAVVGLGQGVRLWAAGHLQRNVELARTGPYRLVRHPLYLGSFLMGVGLALAVEQAVVWLLGFLVLFVLFFWPAMHVEELRLLSLFGPEYQEYVVDTGRLLPRLHPASARRSSPDDASFSWQRAGANREVRSALAMAFLLLVQAVKLLT